MISFQKYNIIEEEISLEKIVPFVDKKWYELSKKMHIIEKKLKDYGLDVVKINKYAKNAAEQSKDKFKKDEGRNQIIQDNILNFMDDLISTKKFFINSDKKTEVRIKNKYEGLASSVVGGILKSIALFAVVYYVNIFFGGISSSLTGSPEIGRIVTTIFITPLVEEVSKLISVKNNFTWEYFTVFNIGEFKIFVEKTLADTNASIGDVISTIISRIFSVGGQLAYTLIHVESHKKGESEKGFKLAWMLHAVWNSLSVMASSIVNSGSLG